MRRTELGEVIVVIYHGNLLKIVDMLFWISEPSKRIIVVMLRILLPRHGFQFYSEWG